MKNLKALCKSIYSRNLNFIMNRGLEFRIVSSFTVISLISIIIISLFSYYIAADTIQKITTKYSIDKINELDVNMFLRFKNIDSVSKVLLNSSFLIQILSKEADEIDVTSKKQIEEELKSIKYSDIYIRSVIILSDNQNEIYTVGDSRVLNGLEFVKNGSYTYKSTEIYKSTITGFDNYIWWPAKVISGENSFMLTRKLYDPAKGTLGVIVILVDEKIMDEVYNTVDEKRMSTMFLVDKDNNILYESNKTKGNKLIDSDILKKIKQNQNGSFRTNNDKKDYFVVFSSFFITDWKFIIFTEYKELISGVERIAGAAIIVSLICLLFVAVLSKLISKGIVKPVRKLVRLMRRGAEGDISVRFSVLYNDEIGQLGEAFNKMLRDIDKLIKEVQHQQKLKVEAEIKILELQINPHFLYNTLSSIYWTAMSEGNTKVGEMVSSLSNYFKLGLNRGKEFTTVGKEVEHVNEYLKIQKMRYDNGFDYSIEADDNVLECKTIRLILQPIVENSLVHGMREDESSKLFITVRVALEEGLVVFYVIDNGLGIPKLKELSLDNIIENGYGLKNVYQRLKLYFEDKFFLTCQSEPNEKTIFKIGICAINDWRQN